jgi:hypothetical protein
LQYGENPADLQHLISTFAAAVLRVSQALGTAAGQLLQQQAFTAAEQVHSQLESLQRDQQLLAVVGEALGCAADLAAFKHKPAGASSEQDIDQVLQDCLQQQSQEHAGLSWRQTLQHLHISDHQGDEVEQVALFG